MKRIAICSVIVTFVFSLLILGSIGYAKPVKIGAIIPYTGIAATVSPEIDRGIQYVLDEAGWEVAGRKIVLIKEDETDDPAIAVAKAKKLVEQDQVDVVIGPLLAHTGAAVAAYLGPLGVPHFPTGTSDVTESKDAFWPLSTGRGSAYITGLFAYDDLRARTAGLLCMDYLFGQQTRDGFADAFSSRGGTIVSNQLIPLGTADMAPFIEGIGKVDVVAGFFVNPSDFGFVRQYREFGLKMPVIFISNLPQEEPLLAQMGDDVLGMYGSSLYSALLDTPVNKRFVEKYKKKFGAYPGMATMHAGYYPTAMYLQAVKLTGGDTSYARIIKTLKGIRGFETPAGSVSITSGRIFVFDQYIFKAVKIGDRYAWDIVKTYLTVQPR